MLGDVRERETELFFRFLLFNAEQSGRFLLPMDDPTLRLLFLYPFRSLGVELQGFILVRHPGR